MHSFIRHSAFVILHSLLVLTASAAEITVTESARVLKDGIDIGAVPDAVKNGVVTPSEVQAALLKLIVATKADADKAKADATTKANHALEKLRAKKAKEEAGGKGKRWEALDELEGELNVTAKDIRIAEIEARKAAIEAELREARKP